MNLLVKNSWDTIELARHKDRPKASHYIDNIFGDFVELHGDRCSGDDSAIIAGFAECEQRSVAIIATEKGTDTKSRIHHNFGCPHPSGYRKANRIMRLAEKFNLPIITLIDTPGAFPGVEAEREGIGMAIANSLVTMSRLQTPIISIIIGEGGSGGALALAVSDVIGIMENSYFSVITPEGCASILWRDKSKSSVKKAAIALKPTAEELLDLGIVDQVIEEKTPAHQDPEAAFDNVRQFINTSLTFLDTLDLPSLIKRRQHKFRNIGAAFEELE